MKIAHCPAGTVCHPLRLARMFGSILAVSAVLAFQPCSLHAQFYQSDNFDDQNDDGWVQYDVLAPFGLHAAFSFTNGGYRIRTPYVTGMAQNPGRGGSTRPEVYSNFYVAVDVVNWDDTLPQSFGLLARVGTPGLQTTTGYSFTWDRGNPTNATAGDVDISKITGEAPTDVRTGPSNIRLQPGHKYRMVFIGRGSALEGRIYELSDLLNPLLVVQGTDDGYSSGQNGLVTFDNSGGRSFTDVTFDNFFATDVEPPRLILTDLTFGDYELSWPREASSYVLQSANAVTGANWEDVTEPIVEFPDNFGFFFSVNPNGPNRFFRLVRR